MGHNGIRSGFKDGKEVLEFAKKNGWTCEQTQKHVKFRHPIAGLVVASLTPSCPHARTWNLKDMKRLMQQKGLPICL